MWCMRKHSWVPHTASPVWRSTGGPGGGCQGHERQGHMCRVTGVCKAPPGESFPSLSLETPRFVWMQPPRRLSGPVCAEPSASPGVPVTAAGSSVAQSSVEMEKGKPRGSSASSPWSSQVPQLRSVAPQKHPGTSPEQSLQETWLKMYSWHHLPQKWGLLLPNPHKRWMSSG